MKAVDLIIKYLEEVGTEYIFGIIGGVLEPLNRAVHKSKKIKGIVAKHEQGAAFMANGYARVKRRLGVCCGTTGPGSTNLITGIATSFADSTPVLALTGQVSTLFFGKGAFQEATYKGVNVVELFKSFTKYTAMIVNPEMTGEMTRHALRMALSGKQGPVHLNLPVNIMEKDVHDEMFSPEQYIPTSKYFDRDNVKVAAELLLDFERPAILLGNGVAVAKAAEEVKELAELLKIPVATTPKAKGVFPENHLMSLGVFGMAGSRLAETYLLQPDVSEKKIDGLLAIGTSFSEWGTNTWDKRLMPSRAMIQVDIDHHECGKNYPFTIALVGDAKTVIRELIYELKRQMENSGETIHKRIKIRNEEFKRLKIRTKRYAEPEKTLSGKIPILPQRLMKDIQNACPEDTLFFVDIGANWTWAIHYLDIARPYTFFTGLGFASMGYAAAASIGAKFAAPDKPVVAIIGDGGFLMNGMEVATAVNYNKQVIWIILNDSGFGMLYHGEKMLSIPEGFATRFKKVDFVRIAEALGAQGVRVSKPGEINRKMMNRIFASGKPTVIDVHIDSKEVPPIHSRAATLNLFT